MNDALALRLTGEPGVRIFDLFGLVTSIAATPAAFGLTNATDAAGPVPGADLSKYFFWDGIHPTATGHAIVASKFYAFTSVPEIDPAGFATAAAIVVCGLGLIERRRRPVAAP